MEVVETRFGVFAKALQGQIEAIEDLAVLKSLLRKAILAGSLEEFRKALEG